jgi:hypothetical protein
MPVGSEGETLWPLNRRQEEEEDMEKIRELFIVVENRPGTLGELLGFLAKEKINIEAIGLFQDIAKISVSDIDRARKALLMHKYEVETRDVLRLELDNKPGTFAFVTSRLANAGLNIDYCYGTVGKGQRTAAVIIDVPDIDRAMSALEGAEH